MTVVKDNRRRAARALLATMPDVRDMPPAAAASVILAEAFQATAIAMLDRSDLSDTEVTQAIIAGLASTAGMFLSFGNAASMQDGAQLLARQTVMAAERHALIRSRKDVAND